MNRSIAAGALMLAVGAALGGCAGPHPYIREGDANSVEVTYAGDVAGTLPLARQYCLQFGRVPRLVDPGVDRAIYHCIHP